MKGKNEILKVYKDFCKDLFKVKMAKTKEEKEVEETIREQMKEIEIKAKEQKPIRFKQEEIDRAIKSLKCGKEGDCEYWKNEIVKKGGEEMSK